MAVVRRTILDYEGHFTQIPNAWLRDDSLTLGATGLLAQLLSHRDGWSVTIESIAKVNGCGRDRIRGYVRELEASGYLQREQARTDGGVFGETVWITTSPTTDLPTTVPPTTVKPTHKKTISKKTIRKTHAHRFAEFWELYPRKVGKAAAQKAFEAVDPDLVDQILDATAVLAADPNLPPKQFIPYPATWLNRAGWEDEPYPDRSTPERKLPAAETPGYGDWKLWYHDQDDHSFCDHD